MASQPVLTFRSNVLPYSALTTLAYVQTKPGGTNLPVVQGENSDNILFRIYNNFALASTIATALNLYVTCYDGVGTGSHTAAFAPVSQSWIHVMENMYGESTPSVAYTFSSYVGADTPIGGTPAGNSKYYPEYGSDGVSGQARIRAGTNQNGYGFIEIKTYASVPVAASATSYTFAISAYYEWSA